jgi:nucleotide-binding universal stress UspA family protein
MAGIVVGVDRSEHALDALRWAMEEAAYRGCPLRIVHVWEPQYVYEDCRGDMAMALGVEWGRRSSGVPEELLQVVLSGRDRPDGLEMTSREGHPGKVLTDLAADADMLVVGSLGRGAFTRHLVRGSVAHYVANHARCPVTVVPPRRTVVSTT